MRRHDILGRVLGIIVFLGGIAALVLVFMIAYNFFNSPLGTIQTPAHTGSVVTPSAQLGNSVATMLVRILLLIVMTIAGSVIAGKGVQMYFASGDVARSRESITPQD